MQNNFLFRRKLAKEKEKREWAKNVHGWKWIHWSLKLILLCCVQTLESPCLKLNMVICALFKRKKRVYEIESRVAQLLIQWFVYLFFAALIREWKINDCSSQFQPGCCVYVQFYIYREGGICYCATVNAKKFHSIKVKTEEVYFYMKKAAKKNQ